MPDKLLTVNQLAEKLQVSSVWIYQKVSKGEIPVIRLGRVIRFSEEAVNRWLEENTKQVAECFPEQEPFNADPGGDPYSST